MPSAYDGAIVILHCWPDNTAGAIDDMCKRLYEKGYRFVALSELFEFKGIKNLPTDSYVHSAVSKIIVTVKISSHLFVRGNYGYY